MAARDEVRLAVPATPEFLRLARVTASGIASRLGFTIDEVEDLRLAIDELCFVLVGNKDRDGSVELHYRIDRDQLDVEGVGRFDDDETDPMLTAFSRQILGALLDDYDVYRNHGGHSCFRLTKRRHTEPEP
ncbi:MAG TPA: ATP-binding protein [Acidimicrobiales bacterium]|nr:ATP-binding protein [Acidimicrobiales bacterium]